MTLAKTHLLKSILFLFLFLTLSSVNGQIKVSKEPNWILPQSYKTEITIPKDEIAYGYIILLQDEQIQIPKQEIYQRVVKKITDNTGIQEVAEISDNYDPKYQTITFHKMNIIRNGEVINKLDLNNFQSIRRESNSENYIYDGRLTAMINLSDIRKNDILDYSYTIKGFNPIHNGNFSGAFSLNSYVYVNKSNIRLLSKSKLDYKLYNSDLKPKITNKEGLNQYQWLSTNVKPAKVDFESPSWLIQYQNLFVSDYRSWENVINWATKLYKVEDNLSSDLKTKIESIKSTHKNDPERITATLEFVQNEIRYLGLEDGIGSYKPFSPNKVFSQRFGDCKDKSLLMVTMLREMDIDAYPMLVNTSVGKSIPKILPTPKAFDHVVVKVILKSGREVYYDPTITNQKGTFDKIYFPNYETGLVIKNDETELEHIQNFSDNLVEVFDEYTIEEIGKGATLKVKSIYSEYEADKMRNYYKNSSLSSIKSDFKGYYSNYFEDVEILEDPIIKDDSLNNEITIYEHYKLNNIWNEVVTEENNIGVTFTPTSIYDILMLPNESSKTKPYALFYPATKRHKIKVKLPEQWAVTLDDYTINSNDFYYDFEGDYDRRNKVLTLNSYYKNQNSYVKPENFSKYYKDIKNLESNVSYYIYINKSYAAADSNIIQKNSNTKPLSSNAIKNVFLYIILPVILILLLTLLIIILKRNSKS